MPPPRKARSLQRSREIAAVLFKPAHLRRTLTIAFLVGSWLTLVNLGDALLASGLSYTLLTKAVLNYLTPYVVANLGLLSRTDSRSEDVITDGGMDKQT